MFALLIVGLSVILRVGSDLPAPADLQGEWTMHWSPDAENLPSRLSLQQSGLFAHGELAGGQSLSGRLSKARNSPAISGELVSRDGQWQLTLAPYAGGNVLTGALQAPSRASFTARRAAGRHKFSAASPSKANPPHARQ
jgi:hypothetical protein